MYVFMYVYHTWPKSYTDTRYMYVYRDLYIQANERNIVANYYKHLYVYAHGSHTVYGTCRYAWDGFPMYI